MSSSVNKFIPVPELRSNTRQFVLWFGVVGGIAAWFVHLVVSWALVPWSCSEDNVAWIHINTAVAAGVTLLAFLAAGGVWRGRNTWQDTEQAETSNKTDRFMSILGMLTSGVFLVLILVEGVSAFVLKPCVVS